MHLDLLTEIAEQIRRLCTEHF